MTNTFRHPSQIQAYAALLAGVFSLTLSPLFIRWAEAPGLVTAFYKMALAAILLAPMIYRAARLKGLPPARAFLFPVVAGIFSAFDNGLWSTAIGLTTVANATLLNNLSPLWVALFAVFVWREKLRIRFWFGLLGIFAGVILVFSSTLLIRPGFVGGDVLAALSSIFYAGFFLITQRGRGWMNIIFYLWAYNLSAAVYLLVGIGLFGYALTGYSAQTYLIFAITAVVVQIGGYAFITFALKTLPASVVTPTMVLQPVLTALVAIPLAGERLLFAQAAGGMITLVGVFLVNTAIVNGKRVARDVAKTSPLARHEDTK